MSETYTIIDYWMIDGGVTGNKNTNWTAISDTVTVDSTGTDLYSTAYNSHGYYISTQQINGDFEVTVDIISGFVDVPFFINFFNSSNEWLVSFLEDNNGNKFISFTGNTYSDSDYVANKVYAPLSLKVTRVGTLYTAYVNGTQIKTITGTSNPVYVGFSNWYTRHTKYKDLKIKAL